MGWTTKKMKRHLKEVRERFHTPVGKASPPLTPPRIQWKKNVLNPIAVKAIHTTNVKPCKSRRSDLELLEEQSHRFECWNKY